ncbi:glycosyl hydrolase family 28-related protein [Niallia sp. 01092]|uniref:glycosyl hydrolase family 28-related protein n=1 Tax=unclassified Niallia TaxID=2837522 RepID=UPI003FD5F9F6
MKKCLVFVLSTIFLALGLHISNQNALAAENPSFKVKDYGAKGNGTTNDTSAILKAIEAAKKEGGGTVYFNNGQYLIKGFIDVPKKVSLKGAGKEKVTLIRNEETVERVLSLMGNQTLEGVGFKSKIGVMINGDDVTIKNVKFSSTVQGIQNSNTVYRLIVDHCLFDGSGYGILSNINPSYDVKITNSRFRNNTADDIEINAPSRRWLIENCIFEHNKSQSEWSGFGVGAAVKAKEITIKNSKFKNIVGQGVAEVSILDSTFKNNVHHTL